MAKTATKNAATTILETPFGNMMPIRVAENEQQASAKIGSNLIANGDSAVRVEGTDPKSNADTELGKNSAGYASGAPGSFGQEVRGVDKKDGYEGEAVDSLKDAYKDDSFRLNASGLTALVDRIRKLEDRVKDLEEASTSPEESHPASASTDIDSMKRALKRAGIQPHPELDKLEQEREQNEKSAAEPAQIE